MSHKAKMYLVSTFVIFPVCGYISVVLMWIIGRAGPASLTKNAWQVLLMSCIYGSLTACLVLKHLDQRVKTIVTCAIYLFFIEFILNFLVGMAGRSMDSLPYVLTRAFFNGLDGVLLGVLAGFAMNFVSDRLQPRTREA